MFLADHIRGNVRSRMQLKVRDFMQDLSMQMRGRHQPDAASRCFPLHKICTLLGPRRPCRARDEEARACNAATLRHTVALWSDTHLLHVPDRRLATAPSLQEAPPSRGKDCDLSIKQHRRAGTDHAEMRSLMFGAPVLSLDSG